MRLFGGRAYNAFNRKSHAIRPIGPEVGRFLSEGAVVSFLGTKRDIPAMATSGQAARQTGMHSSNLYRISLQ